MAVKSRPESYSEKPIVPLEGGTERGSDVESSGFCIRKSYRRKIDIALNSVGLQLAVVIIVFLQVPILGSLLLIDFDVIRSSPSEIDPGPLPRPNGTAPKEAITPPGGETSVDLAERILHTINIVILLLFLIEIILRVLARGSRIHLDGKQVFDCGVVMLSFVLYVAFTAASLRRAAYGAGFLILLRLWRIQRIAATIAENERRRLEKTLASHRKAQKEAEEQLKNTTSKLTAMQQEMEVLQQQLKVMHYIGKASPAISSSAYSKVSEDLVTSDEESERYTDCDSQAQTPKILETLVHAEMGTGLQGRRLYTNNSLTTSCTPSPATSFSHLVDEFLHNSEFKDFKDLSSLSKAAPTKVSVPDLVEHLQAAEAKAKQADDISATPGGGGGVGMTEEVDITRDSASSKQQLTPQSSDGTTQQYQQFSPSHRASHARSDENGAIDVVGKEKEAGSSQTTQVAPESTESTPASPVRNTTSSQNETNGDVSTRQKGKLEDKRQLLALSKSPSPDINKNEETGGHDNPGFESDLSPEEQEEVKRVSQVPFNKQYGSTTYLNEDGIPMTDL